MRKMLMDKSREGRTLMIADERTALLPAGAGCDAGKWESDGGRKSGVVGAGNDYERRALGEGL